MTGRHLTSIGALALAIAAGTVGFAGPAGAQADACDDGVSLGSSISLAFPTAGASLAGTITVRGTASTAPPLTLSRVEVTLGRVTNNHTFASANSLNFKSEFETRAMDQGPTTLRIVACQTGLTGALAYAAGSIPVTIDNPTTTTSGTQSSTTAATGGGTQGGATNAGVTTTRPAGQAAAAPSTVASTPPTTEPRVDAFRPDPVKPKSAGEAPLILTETPAKKSPRPPLWVGAVVGLSGAIGLGFSAASWRRRAHPPDIAEPLDPDLVEVG